MKKSHYFALMAAGALMSLAGLTACSSSNDMDEMENPNVVVDDQGNAGVRPEFVISIPRSVVGSKTRMSDAETQSSGSVNDFRGMDHIRLIAFSEVPTGSSTKLGSIMSLTSIANNALKKPGSLNYKVYANQFVPMTTTNFLFYGKAIENTAETDITTMADKFKYGVIKVKGLTDADFTSPNSISFGLEQINTSTERQQSNDVGRNIVRFMTSLANITSTGTAPENAWSTCSDARLKPLYDNFIRTTVSSSANLAAILGILYDGVSRVITAQPSNTLAKDILDMIAQTCTTTPTIGSPVSLKDDYAGYPANVGLPDGAARVRWNGTEFEDMSASYGGGMKVGITDYVYPAALWYYVSTPIKASDAVQSANYDSKDAWSKVINEVYSGAGDAVGGNTLSVALVNPVQYAVGRLETKLEMGSGTFYDGAGQEVVTGSGYTLKGLLLGGQNDAKFDFTTSTSSGTKNWTIYDREVPTGINVTPGNTTATANQTLALETKKDEKVYAAVELVNGGEAFQGADGIIPAGGTFYLTVKLEPTTATNYNATTLNKIITQDYVTKLTVKIKNGSQSVDRDGDGNPDVYALDPETGEPIGVITKPGTDPVTTYDINGDGKPDTFIADPDKGGPGWDTDGDGIVDIPIMCDPSTGEYPTNVLVPEGLGNATNGIPNLTSPGVELGTSVDLEWKPGLNLTPSI